MAAPKTPHAAGRVWRILRAGVTAVGALTIFLVAWFAAGFPVVIDRWLMVNEEPMAARAIVCVTGGLTWHNLPPDDGLQRIYTSVQLFLDKYAPVIVFSGGGGGTVSEAEVYAEAARWFGLPDGVARFDPGPATTAEHAVNLLQKPELGITRDTPLLVVTSPSHSRRVALCFRKAGFTKVRVVSRFVAANPDPRVRERRPSILADFRASPRKYDDVFNRVRWGLGTLITTLREAAAIAVYRWKGYA